MRHWKKKCLVLALLAMSPAAFGANVVIFGDSLSDIGQKGWEDLEGEAKHLPATYLKADGTRNWLYGEHVAQAFGGQLQASSKGGTDFAYSGGVLLGKNSTWTSGDNPQPNVDISVQIQNYLQRGVHPDYLHILWGGGNDIAAILAQAIAQQSDQQAAVSLVDKGTQEVASASAKEWKILKNQGITLIVAPKVPNIFYTPEFFHRFGGALVQQLRDNVQASVDKLDAWSRWFASDTPKGIANAATETWSHLWDEAPDSTQNSLDALNKKRAQMIDDFVERLWAYKIKSGTGLVVSIKYGNYGNLLARGNITQEALKTRVHDAYNQLSEAATSAVDLLNERTSRELQHVGGNIVRLPVDKLLLDFISRPETYGFRNTVTAACKDSAVQTLCGVALDNEPNRTQKTYDMADSYLFADSFHPGPVAHQAAADFLLSTLRAPNDVALLRQIAQDSVKSTNNFVINNSNLERQQSTEPRVKAIAALESSAGSHTRHLGAKVKLSDRVELGLVVSRHARDAEKFSVKSHINTTQAAGSLRYDAPHWWLGATASLHRANLNNTRTVNLARARFTEPSLAMAEGASLGAFGGFEAAAGVLNMQGFARVNLIKGKVNGFVERNNSLVSMSFAQQNYNALETGLGGRLSLKAGGFTPFVSGEWQKEWRNKHPIVTATLDEGTFTLPVTREKQAPFAAKLGASWVSSGNTLRITGALGKTFGGTQHQTAAELALSYGF